MTAFLRVIDAGLAGARRNVAVSAALTELHAEGRIPDTLRLHRYPRSVLIGRSQGIDLALDRAACARLGAEIARRVTGGGAVAMAPGVLAWDLVVGRRRWPSLEAASADLGEAVAGALGGLGIAAAFRPPGEVAVAGCKVAGLSGAFEGATLLHQGSLLVDADLAEMAALLGLRALPVATLAGVSASVPTIPAIGAAIARAFAAALGMPARQEPLGAAEAALADELLAGEIGTAAFVEGEPVP